MNLPIYLIFKFIHLLGVVILVGNVTVTAVWKVFADRTRSATTVAFAQQLVTGTDWAFTVGGIVLLMVGGYGMAASAQISLTSARWLVWGQALFFFYGAIWLLILVPIQVAQAKLMREFGGTDAVPDAYWRMGNAWLWWGIVATIPLIAAMFLMVTKF